MFRVTLIVVGLAFGLAACVARLKDDVHLRMVEVRVHGRRPFPAIIGAERGGWRAGSRAQWRRPGGARAGRHPACRRDAPADQPVRVQLPGGPLTIRLTADRVWMTGPARFVFAGQA